MKRTLILAAVTLALSVVFPRAARALDDSHCSSGAVGHVRTYLSINNASGDTRANADGRIRLKGWVYIPSGPEPEGGFPVIVFNHGSEEEPAAKCVLADYFVDRGYILFVPIRRGHAGSTGVYFADYVEAQVAAFCPPLVCTPSLRRQFTRLFTTEYLREQREDVRSAVHYIRNNYPKANDNKFGVIGHSYGAIVTLFFDMLQVEGVKAVVDISAGAQSWGETDPDDYLQQQLKDAVQHAQHPIYFLQPKNDVTTLPTAELSYVAALRNIRYQAAIFGPVPDALIQPCPRPDPNNPGEEKSCGDVAHAEFVGDSTQVARWAPSVIEFLGRFGVH